MHSAASLPSSSCLSMHGNLGNPNSNSYSDCYTNKPFNGVGPTLIIITFETRQIPSDTESRCQRSSLQCSLIIYFRGQFNTLFQFPSLFFMHSVTFSPPVLICKWATENQSLSCHRSDFCFFVAGAPRHPQQDVTLAAHVAHASEGWWYPVYRFARER